MAPKQKLQRLAALMAAGQSRSPAVGRGEEGGQAAEAFARSRGHGKSPKSHRQETTAKNKNGEQAACNSEGLARRARKKQRKKQEKRRRGRSKKKQPGKAKHLHFKGVGPKSGGGPEFPKSHKNEINKKSPTRPKSFLGGPALACGGFPRRRHKHPKLRAWKRSKRP